MVRDGAVRLLTMRVMGPAAVARKQKVSQSFQGDLPSHARKNNPLRARPKSVLELSPSRPARGAYRDRHGRWAGLRWTRKRQAREGIAGRVSRERCQRARRMAQLRTAKACGSGTRGWCQAGGDLPGPTGLRGIVNSPAMEARGIRLQGERGISRQTIAQGRPDAPADTCMLVCVFSALIAHETSGASQHPAFPAASDFLGA